MRQSNVVKCPTNCEHDFYFQHSCITVRREFVENGVSYVEVSTFIVCRECSHWIDATLPCRCVFKCHQEENGTEVVRYTLDSVN